MQAQETTVLTPENIEPVQQQSWRDLALPWWNATLAILPTFLVTRFLLLLLAYFGGVLFIAANFSPSPVSYHDLLAAWNQGDEVNYLAIATDGYTRAQQAFFFPLYPTLVRMLSPLLHHSMLASGFVLSNLAFFGAMIVFYRLIESEFDSDTAKRSVLYLAIFPTALFFFVASSDSLFLLLILLSFYTLRHGLWWLAGLFGLLATLTRFEGIFLFVIFLYEYVRQQGPHIRQGWDEKRGLKRMVSMVDVLASLLIPLALLIYSFALKTIFGDPFAFMHAQVQQSAGFSFPLVGPLVALKDIVRQPHTSFVVAHTLLDFTALALFVVLLVLCFFGPERLTRKQWTFAMFGLLLLLYALSFPGSAAAHGSPYDALPSLQRLVLVIFPGFIVLARLGRRAWFHQGYLLLALPMLAFFVLQFITGHWIV